MKEFIFLFRGGSYPEIPEQRQALAQKWGAWIQDLMCQQKYAGGEQLQEDGKTVTGKRKVITDGPFIESKEMVGGFIIVMAENLEEATEISKDCPIFQMEGRLEIRQVQKMEM